MLGLCNTLSLSLYIFNLLVLSVLLMFHVSECLVLWVSVGLVLHQEYNEHEPSNDDVHVKWHTYNVSVCMSVCLSLSRPTYEVDWTLGKRNVKDKKSLSVCQSVCLCLSLSPPPAIIFNSVFNKITSKSY